MCYYNGQKVTRAEFIKLKALEKAVSKYSFWNGGVHNGFMFQPAAIAIANDDKTDFEIIQAQWGYVPASVKSRDEALAFLRRYLTMNFKGENIFTNDEGRRSMWADAVKNGRRCLVLSTGIVESRHVEKLGKKGQPLAAKDKYPYMVTMKEQEYFWFPGLYNQWLDPDTGELVYCFALGTTPANKLMKQIHNSKERMPTILNDDLAYEWLMGNPSNERLTQLALTQVPSRDMEYCTISKEYLTTREAVKQDYPELAPIDMSYLDTTELLLHPAA
ncbi:MAG: SOS response-associated peptidase family protein [Bacteroidetes bacterium]|nr:SOS response-associated peptidase family protein [Bacteroidota bacterium]